MVALTAMVVAAAVVAAWRLRVGADAQAHPRQALEMGADGVAFVDERACAGCHAAQAEAWRHSHHARAMEPATDSTVAGDFDGVAFTHFGVTTRFHRDGDRFLVDTEGADGEPQTFQVRYTFGTAPLQQYLVGLPGGRLQALTVAWDTDRDAWFSLQPDERITPSDPLHWTGRFYRWNDRCAECHSTDLRVGYDAASNQYATTWAAVNVGCQACHGPGGRHIEWTRAAQARSAAADAPPSADTGLLVDPGARPDAELWTCARCHSRRGRASAEDGHGRGYFDDFDLALLRAGLYHADGQILDEVYVTGSFLQSRMQRRGVACGDCHDAHSGALRARGNALCTRCHQPQPPATFPTLRAGAYDTTAHHQHAPGGAGALCVDCHMPERTYMVIDERRDHSLRVPRPDLSVELGTPNACSMCHDDRTPAWAAAAVDRWYGRPSRPDHFARAIAAGRAGEPGADERLRALAGDTAQPGIARATALALLTDGSADATRSTIAAALADHDPIVRRAAVDAAGLLPHASQLALLPAALTDTIGGIRIAAARLLAPLGPALTDPVARQSLERELGAYRATQRAQADQPEANHNLGSLAAELGDLSTAETAYRRALAIDSAFLPPYVNLANLYNRQGRNGEAERMLRHALRLAPDEGELHYSLGLLLAEMQRTPEAVAELGIAAARLPERARVHYNYGLALQRADRPSEAETALQRAYTLTPDDPAFVTGLVYLYRRTRQWQEATYYAERLVTLLPDAPGPRQLLRDIEAERAR